MTDIGIKLYAFRAVAIDHTQDAGSLIAFSKDDLHWIGGGAEDVYDFPAGFDRREEVDREGSAHDDQEAVSCPQSQHILEIGRASCRERVCLYV